MDSGEAETEQPQSQLHPPHPSLHPSLHPSPHPSFDDPQHETIQSTQSTDEDSQTPLGQSHASACHDESPQDDPTPINGAPARPSSKPTSAHELHSYMPADAQHGRTPSTISSWSTNSDRQLGHGGSTSSDAEPCDRVFPIRSVVSVDESQPTPWVLARNSADFEYFPRQDTTWNGRRPSNPRVVTDSSAGVRRVETLPPSSAGVGSPTDRVVSSRSKRHHTVSESRIGSPLPDGERLASAGPPPMFNDTASDASDRTGPSRHLADGDSEAGVSTGRATPADLNEDLVTVRFQHVLTEDGHAVITGRDSTMQRCEDEPIHTPGAVQAFGLLVVLREDHGGRFSVRTVSENSGRIIGFSPQQLFKLNSFTEIFSEEQAENLLDHIDFIRDDEADPVSNGPDVFSISVRPPKQRTIKLWCAMHINDSHPDLILCEFELEDDAQHPLRPPDENSSDEPEDTLYQQPTAEELHESTEVGSRPLRVLRSARKRRGEAGAMQVFDVMSQVQEQLANAPNLEKFLKILVGIVKELTGFHRVMVYQFDSAFNGKVVTELVDPAATRDLYHGLHFPASDIPKQARELYKLNKVRLLYDRDLESARLVCRTLEDLETPLDLSHAYLRAMSPIHLKYLANMAVRSSMSISINAFGELWGLITCHGYGRRGMRVPFPIRKMCRLVGDTASRNIERLSYASRLQARKLINTMPTDKNPSGYIIASSDDLLTLFDADFGMLSIRGETKILGKIEQSQEALAMLEYLRLRSYTSVLTTQDLRQDFPDLRYPPGFAVIAGLLYVPLSVGGNDFIVFFRKGQIREVKWAGNPYDKVIKEGTAQYLEPRSSFKVWHETVVGKCREWTEEQVETAAVLCLVYGKFIEVWRQKEAALQNSRLTRLLLANSAHEVRTPLNAIINYLEIALEGSLDHETRENLARSHSASKSLIYVINDLLDLTKTEEGQNLIKDEILDLPACIREATEAFQVDAKRKGIAYDVIEHPGLPQYVHGDFRRVRQAVSNLTANAMQHTTAGSIKVEAYVIEVLESRVRVEIAVHDTGRGMSNEKLDNLFQDLEQVSSADLGDPTALDEEVEKPGNERTLGLGLAVVARIVRNMDGQLRLKSQEGKGSRFVIQLPFEIPSGKSLEKLAASDDSVDSKATSTLASVTKAPPPAEEGEVLLVDRGSANAVGRQLSEKRSFDETTSMSSAMTGASVGVRSNMSDAERLIDAIQTPLSLGDPDEESLDIERRNSGVGHHRRMNTSTTSLPGPDAIQPPPAIHTSDPERPLHLRRSTTIPAKPRGDADSPGQLYVKDTKTPIMPVKVPDEYLEQPTAPQTGTSSRVLFEIPDKSSPGSATTGKHEPSSATDSGKLRVLVAEDDPINMKILKKRLEKAGHAVTHATNGEVCAIVYKEKPAAFDIILMDMQMPIVDGLSSTKMIRAFERSDECSAFSSLASSHGGVPIFAVSASLVEKEKPIYVEAGFDGWILKPIDFKRLNVLLEGITKDDVREQCLYETGEWERGGWFTRRSPSKSFKTIHKD
ncbi:Uu.00g120970.m01.CDS01 [Anthostomella pinea]|uniref:Uu.00g120970.m01.CDS01 n=1 Tax=Anthostomella pinea TaxID=933095 RepID=A0AAI8VGU5_9PEZI|nr:Uu.00g120970.m01.CDS01 [Anthostomella pinea]